MASVNQIVGQCSAMVRNLLKLPARNVWIDYDKEADVLYMSFRKPQRATKTVEVGEDILVRKSGRSIVGVTIMNASARR
jgi:uncharacterized protein YuzE